jgi:hypothetical protein
MHIQVLRQQQMLLPSTHVISNRLVYDGDGTAVAFDSHIIHPVCEQLPQSFHDSAAAFLHGMRNHIKCSLFHSCF